VLDAVPAWVNVAGMTGIPAERRPIRPQKLYEQVSARLEARIIDKTYDAGDLLPSERDLMREFGVGRPAIREALIHLRNIDMIIRYFQIDLCFKNDCLASSPMGGNS